MDGRVRERSASQARSDADADARARAHGLTQEAVRHRAAPCSNRCVHTAPAGTVPSLRRQRHPPTYLGFEGADAEDEVLRELRLVHVQHMNFERANQRLPRSTARFGLAAACGPIAPKQNVTGAHHELRYTRVTTAAHVRARAQPPRCAHSHRRSFGGQASAGLTERVAAARPMALGRIGWVIDRSIAQRRTWKVSHA